MASLLLNFLEFRGNTWPVSEPFRNHYFARLSDWRLKKVRFDGAPFFFLAHSGYPTVGSRLQAIDLR